MHSLWMVAASLLFAGVAVCVKLGATQFSPAELVFYRGFVALLLIAAYVILCRRTLATRHWKAHAYRGIAGFLSMVSYFHAISHIALATAVTLNFTSSLFIAAMVVFWWREPVRIETHLVLLTGFVGVALLLQPTLNREQWLPALIGLCSGFFSAMAFLNVRALGRLGEPEWRMLFYFSLFSTIAGLPWLLHAPHPFHRIDLKAGLVLLGVGGFGAAAQICMAIAFMRGKALVNANLGYLTVVFSSLLGLLIWGEVLSLISWAGMALVIGSGVMSTVLSRAGPGESAPARVKN